MADPADIANDYTEQMTEEALRRAKESAAPLRHNGRCHNCGEAVEPWENFCDEHCRDDWEKREDAAKRRLGDRYAGA